MNKKPTQEFSSKAGILEYVKKPTQEFSSMLGILEYIKKPIEEFLSMSDMKLRKKKMYLHLLKNLFVTSYSHMFDFRNNKGVSYCVDEKATKKNEKKKKMPRRTRN